MLELRPGCECCDRDLPPDSDQAFICSFECTFCRTCADTAFGWRCPNCGGELLPRPIRPAEKARTHPASTRRVHRPERCPGGLVADPAHGGSADVGRRSLSVLAPLLAVCRQDPRAGIPSWALEGDFFAVVRTPGELSVVCPEARVPAGTARDGGWRGLEVDGPMALTLTGVLAGLTGPLARAGIAIFAISTHDTDYVLVKEERLAAAREALRRAGHTVRDG